MPHASYVLERPEAKACRVKVLRNGHSGRHAAALMCHLDIDRAQG